MNVDVDVAYNITLRSHNSDDRVHLRKKSQKIQLGLVVLDALGIIGDGID